ncbi:MAG: FtsX-like permease family protein, partial [Clostridia bacterium]|nr:FtsX-like permease family protein [Clostridia bacterium]
LASMTSEQMVMALTMALPNYTTEQCALYYDEVMEFSKSSYDNNLQILGYVDLEDPYTVNLFASSFENKDVIEEVIAQYNEGVEDLSKIRYTDYIGLMMSSITTIINAITYVLIAFVAISLVVSSIMIGVITLISVQERTKEIGILRAIGASKRNVSGMFNAETMIIGFASGLLGVIITYLLCIPINFVINTLTGIPSLDAYLPLPTAVILVVISVLLTLISGIIPSRSAAKKDPVVALRTE